jgi:hypothetical protein
LPDRSRHAPPFRSLGPGGNPATGRITTVRLAAALLAAQLSKAPRRRLTFAAVGASTSGRGAVEADEMLAEGFGHD